MLRQAELAGRKMFAVAGSPRRLHFFEPLELLIGGRIDRLKSGTVFPSAARLALSFRVKAC
jgi:hypothetical protein